MMEKFKEAVWKFPLDHKGKVPLKSQVASEISRRIISGELGFGDKLPSSRQLAEILAVARVTVTAAYSELSQRGLISPSAGRGGSKVIYREIRSASSKEIGVKKHSKALQAMHLSIQEGVPFSIAGPDDDSLPGKRWTQIVGRVSKSPWNHNGYAEPGGFWPFREEIAKYVRRNRELVVGPEQVIVTTGVQQGLALSCQVLFKPGDCIVVEDPGYVLHRRTFEYFGMRPISASTDEKGINIQNISDASENPKGVLFSPNCQYPLGVEIVPERLEALENFIRQNRAWILQNDFSTELWYSEKPKQGFSQCENRLVHLNTFTGTIYPGFNIGYLIVPKDLVDSFERAKLFNDRHTSEVHQAILAEFMKEGWYDSHVRRLAKLYRNRKDALFEEGDRVLGSFGSFLPLSAGKEACFVFSEPVDDLALALFLKEKGIQTRALSLFYQSVQKKTGLVLGFAHYREGVLKKAVQELGTQIFCFLTSSRR